MIKTKSRDVVFTELTPALAHIFWTLSLVDRSGELGTPDELVITSINDGVHMPNSRHYRNEAIDIRSHNFSGRESKRFFREGFELLLGPKFRVILENLGKPNEHFHVQVLKGMTYP